MTNLALGMKGHNFYIFTGGPNPPGAGATTDLYDYDAAIGARGEVRPLYQAQKNLGDFLQAHPWLVQAERETDCRFGLDFEAARAHTYWKRRGDVLFSPRQAFEFLHAGALTSALCAGFSPAYVDLAQTDWIADSSTPVFVPAASSLAANKQEHIVRFLQQGGKLLIAPVLPTLDENLEPCTILADFLGRPAGAPPLSDNLGKAVRINIAGQANVLTNGSLFSTNRLPAGAEVLGQDEFSGLPVAWQVRTTGDGQAIFLGMSWSHAMHEHRRTLAALLGSLGLRPKITCSDPNLWATLWTAGERSLLFVLNLFTAPLEAEIRVWPASRPDPIDLGRRTIPPVSVITVEITS
jgi:beta-galactosidase